MRNVTSLPLTVAALTLVMIVAGPALAQHEHHEGTKPGHHDDLSAPEQTGSRVGDPYPLSTCPITGKKLGSMGDPVVKLYDGREVRFCCPMCPEKFEKDKAANFTKLDEQIIKDQGPLYPLRTSLVTGKDLPPTPYEFVYGNRLIRLGGESEKVDFVKDPTKYLGALDKAVIAAQGKDYLLKTCPSSKEQLGGAMGEPVDLVVGGRLIRLCCKDCKKDVEKDPARYIGIADEARKGAKSDHDHKHGC